jgi:3-methyladenine DNA glycosylase AlkD
VLDVAAAVAYAERELGKLADATAAADMARYMKTTMPFYGVKTPERAPIARVLAQRWVPQSAAEYRHLVVGLWGRSHREMKYLAIGAAIKQRAFIGPPMLLLYRRLIVTGAWWDLVDGVASDLVGKVLLENREWATPRMRQWLHHDDMWLRRTAIISQLTHKRKTDAAFLFECCAARADETEFFILQHTSMGAPRNLGSIRRRIDPRSNQRPHRDVLRRSGRRCGSTPTPIQRRYAAS